MVVVVAVVAVEEDSVDVEGKVKVEVAVEEDVVHVLHIAGQLVRTDDPMIPSSHF